MIIMKLKQQIRRLLALECVGYFRPAGCVWVLLLAGRGFSLAEIGLAEGFFHLVSMICEIPSGMLADLLGRKRTLAAGQIMSGLSAAAMLLSDSMAGVCLGMALSAMGYNLASGTREAITYDSLVAYGVEEGYLKLSSRQNVVYRLTAAAAMLCAGATAAVGYRLAYAADILFALAGTCAALSLWEPVVTKGQRARENAPLRGLWSRLRAYLGETLRFLREHPRTLGLMLFNALVGAFATLLGFYLQDALPGAGAHPALLGPLLVAVGLGGAAGSHAAAGLARLPYRTAAVFSCAAIACGYLMAASNMLPLMAAGGFLAVAGDDCLQTLTDARLNQGLPSDQRATLISVSSMCFSLMMVVLSPLTGALVS